MRRCKENAIHGKNGPICQNTIPIPSVIGLETDEFIFIPTKSRLGSFLQVFWVVTFILAKSSDHGEWRSRDHQETGLWLLELLTFSHQRLLCHCYRLFSPGPNSTREACTDWFPFCCFDLSLLNTVPWWSAVWSGWLIIAKEELLKENKNDRSLFLPSSLFSNS